MEKVFYFMKYLKKYGPFNEGLKSWVSIFVLLSSLGMVPLSVKSSTPSEQKEFVDSQPQEVIDAAKFASYIKEKGLAMDFAYFNDFKKDNPDVKTSSEEVKKVLSKTQKDIHNFIPTNWVSDLADIIPDQSEELLNAKIERFKDSSTVEIAVVTVQTLGDEPISDYAQNLFQRLGIGSKVNNSGVLIVVSQKDRKMRIHTGYGVEGALPDMVCGRIGRDVMAPYFKKGDYYGGIDEAINTIIERIGDERKEFVSKEKSVAETSPALSDTALFTIMSLAILILIGVIVLIKRSADKVEREYIKSLISRANRLLKLIDTISFNETESKKLNDMFQSITTLKSEIESILKDKNKWNETKESSILTISKNAEVIVNNFIEYSNKINIVKNSYKLDSKYKLRQVKSLLTDSNRLADQLNGMGISTIAPKSNIDESTFERISRSINQGDLDAAVLLYDSVVAELAALSKTQSFLSSRISSLENDKKTIDNWENLYNQKYKSSEFERYADSSDKTSLNRRLNDFKTRVNNPDYSETKSHLNSLLDFLDGPKNAYLKKKREEEEEERRRRSSYTSYSSSSYDSSGSSSSSSSSDFSGFSGGSSGGGGSDSSW